MGESTVFVAQVLIRDLRAQLERMEARAEKAEADLTAARSEIERRDEANRKLHRRVQVSERFQAALEGGAAAWTAHASDKQHEFWAAFGIIWRHVKARLDASKAEVATLLHKEQGK